MRILNQSELQSLAEWKKDVLEWVVHLNYFYCSIAGFGDEDKLQNKAKILETLTGSSSQVIAHKPNYCSDDYTIAGWKKNRNKFVTPSNEVGVEELLKVAQTHIIEISLATNLDLIDPLSGFTKNPTVLVNPKTTYGKSIWNSAMRKVRQKNEKIVLLDFMSENATINILANDGAIKEYFNHAISAVKFDDDTISNLKNAGWWGKIVIKNRDIDRKAFSDSYSYLEFLNRKVGMVLRSLHLGDTYLITQNSPFTTLSFYIQFEKLSLGLPTLCKFLRKLKVPDSTVIASQDQPKRSVTQVY